MKHEIIVTESALAYIQKMLANDDGIAFKLSIKKTGCSGYSYVPSIIKQVNPKDVEITDDNDPVKIVLDSAWLNLLAGIKVDYIEENKLGLKQKRLVFINPKEKTRCGCGESFHVE